ncbi:hypothetical protein L0Y40_01520 [Candidatus Wolfebacteria bacterium]|nr:hypothetical protein [Candidatus Wolfebacteria bacterium]
MTDYRGDIPDQNLFEPDEEREHTPTWRDKLYTTLKWGVAFFALLGLVYLSGVYQALLLHRTPESFVREPLAQVIPGDELTVPVRIIVLGSDTSDGERWEDFTIAQLVTNTSAILHQAGIGLAISHTERKTVTRDTLRGFLENPAGVAEITRRSDNEITVVLLESLWGLNGIAFVGGDVVAVADYTGSFNDRVLAHEVGHILGLEHVADSRRLMAQGSEGLDLVQEEAVQVRNQAILFVDL